VPSALQTLVIVIPARNEEARLGSLLEGFPQALGGIERMVTVVIDDGSTDRSGAIARAGGAILLTHRISLGKGGALRTGCEAAVQLGADLIVTMDADGQHEPRDLAALVAPLLSGKVDVVLGRRQLAGNMPGAMRAGNRLLSAAVRLLFGIAISDTQCGFRAFRAAVYPQLCWEATDYAVESEMLVRMSRAQLRHVEVPVATVYHDRYKGTQPLDGLRILRQLLAWRIGV
jgi:glycosyltransferase involved in cell wall biosynthesis